MSIIIDITYKDETFEVEIDDDLDIIFLNHDIQFDQAAREFGYPDTPALGLLRSWKNDPTGLIVEDFGLSQKYVVLLAADWAEHVWPIFHKYLPHDRRIRMAVLAARKYIDSSISMQSAEAAWYNSMKAVNDAMSLPNKTGAEYAAAAARDAVHSSFSIEQWKSLACSTTWYALHAAAHEASTGTVAIDFSGSVAYKAEKDWQIRHAMEVVEYLQGKRASWPGVEVSV